MDHNWTEEISRLQRRGRPTRRWERFILKQNGIELHLAAEDDDDDHDHDDDDDDDDDGGGGGGGGDDYDDDVYTDQ
jgi:hypothetical protein